MYLAGLLVCGSRADDVGDPGGPGYPGSHHRGDRVAVETPGHIAAGRTDGDNSEERVRDGQFSGRCHTWCLLRTRSPGPPPSQCSELGSGQQTSPLGPQHNLLRPGPSHFNSHLDSTTQLQ